MESLVGTLTIGSVISAQEYEFEWVNCNETYLPKEDQWEPTEEFEIDPHQDWFWATVNEKLHLVNIYATNGQGPFWFCMFRNIKLVKFGEMNPEKPLVGDIIKTKETEIFIIPDNRETPESRWVGHISTH